MYYSMTAKEAAVELNTSTESGLSAFEAHDRFVRDGSNVLEKKKERSIFLRFFDQFKDAMIIILLIAAAVSVVASKEYIDAAVILLIVLVNATVGVIQEGKAQKALEALESMTQTQVKVIREGKTLQMDAALLAVGDLIILEAGDAVGADCRLVEAVNLKTDESALTGESVPVDKSVSAVKPDTPLAERACMVYSGTNVTYGRAKAIVTAIGMKTQMGQIAHMLNNTKDAETPIQKKLREIGKLLGFIALAICALIFLIGVLRGEEITQMFMLAISLAVAAVPEGLPAIVTIVLAMGVGRLAKVGAIVKKLPAVETLGGASIICSDKTGTLTQNKMKVVEVLSDNPDAILYAALCCDAQINHDGGVGEATEIAIVEAAREKGLLKSVIDENYPRVAEVPFDSVRKLMTTVHKTETGYRVITKGAPDVLLRLCSKAEKDGAVENMTGHIMDKIDETNSMLAQRALRVLAVAYKDVDELLQTPEDMEKDLTFIALIGMIDPPREEVRGAVALCKKAGVRPIMITGDHMDTAVAIAKELGIWREGDLAISGTGIDNMTQGELEYSIDKYSVYARVTPEAKVRIVQAWQKRGKIVAMTGDGVNDAPALRCADIGCAMGKGGTEVSRNAADMVLTDDNFATIVEAVKEGRGIYTNIRKAIAFLLSCNIGEIFAILAATVAAIGSPLEAIQLLWVNLITDSLPALALGMEKTEDDVMEKKPRDKRESIFAHGLFTQILWQGILIGAAPLCAYIAGGCGPQGRTMAFLVLAFSQLMHTLDIRSEHLFVRSAMLSNPYLLGAVGISILLQMMLVLVPPLSAVFGITSIGASQWGVVIILSVMPMLICEAVKAVKLAVKKNAG
ncbi:MAG: calcium-translocating P-type ATPase, PMCA-type [Clostridia bacterium]|nr:calcium-translocating P-type ATPase, PMCA-type [Clostridia bacterium]